MSDPDIVGCSQFAFRVAGVAVAMCGLLAHVNRSEVSCLYPPSQLPLLELGFSDAYTSNL